MQNRFAKFMRLVSQSWAGLSHTCLLVAFLFFALSLAPSLLPRTPIIQGLLSGFTAAVGFGVGSFFLWLWSFLEIPMLSGRVLKFSRIVATATIAVLVVYFLWLASTWQDSVRELMSMEKLEGLYAPVVVLIAMPTMLLLIQIGRAFAWFVKLLSNWIGIFIPRRIAGFVGFLLASVFIFTLSTGTIGRWAVETLDSAFLYWDNVIDDDISPPLLASFTGGPGSLLDWRGLGRQGRRFISLAPTQQEISKFLSQETKQPIRVYVGLGGAETPEARAELALAEMKRVEAFDRSILVVATPTGTGWVDPAAIDSLEYLHRGDTAVVALQYSYLTSYVSLFLEPGYAAASATALFRKVYGHWSKLPRHSRPKLYLHGLSLGSYGSEQSTDLYFILDDLVHGAVWSGPPFRNSRWASFTRNRNPDSPEWLPKFRDGSMVRFTNQTNALHIPGAKWGPLRIVYLQYASDPITFFSPYSLFQEPDWLIGKRGPDVSPKLSWYPIVTALQIAFDMTQSAATERGFGHMYSASHYIDAWLEVTEPQGWTPEDVERLKVYLVEKTKGF